MSESSAIVESPPFTRAYADKFLEFSHGRGCRLYDAAGASYLDFGSGISVNALGYGRKDLSRIAAKQMRRLIHVSNLYTTRPAIDLAARLVSLGEFEAVHFGNSGSEANESAIKFARLYAKRTAGEGKTKLLCFANAFHGRTLGALSVTPTEKYQAPFGPLLSGVSVGSFDDAKSLEVLDTGEYCGVIVEPIQGEGGLHKLSGEFAKSLNEACKRNDVLIIADEVQTGLGRCGFALASMAVGLNPDIVSLSKPLAAGLPLSATLIPKRVNELISTGEHGTTFGGGPVTTSVALKVTETLLDPEFLRGVQKRAKYLAGKLEGIVETTDGVEEVRGLGMLRGVALADERASAIGEIVSTAQDEGLLILRSGKRVIRIAPPLVIRESEIDEGISILSKIIQRVLG